MAQSVGQREYFLSTFVEGEEQHVGNLLLRSPSAESPVTERLSSWVIGARSQAEAKQTGISVCTSLIGQVVGNKQIICAIDLQWSELLSCNFFSVPPSLSLLPSNEQEMGDVW